MRLKKFKRYIEVAKDFLHACCLFWTAGAMALVVGWFFWLTWEAMQFPLGV